MEIEFSKYAILIGIDDYEENPESTINLKSLKGCVKDIQNMKKTLINKCGFKEKNIYTIESTEEKTESEIRNKIDILLKNINESFEKGKDSIYFHFSGHGLLNEASSYIMLHSSPLEVLEIPKIIDEKLKPKHQFYTFDCCHCGEITYIRGSETEEEKIKNYFEKSSGMAILYACKKTQKALETAEGGKLTNSMIKIISDIKYYDKDKILSSGTLIEQVKKEMINEKQEPIGISETSGYYPFASKLFWRDIDKVNEIVEKEECERTMVEIAEERPCGIFSDEQKYHSDRRTTSENFLSLIEENINSILNTKGIVPAKRSINNDLLPKIYNSLDYTPLNSGLARNIKIKSRNNMLIGYQIESILGGEETDKYEYSLRADSLKYIVEYSLKNEFSNSFKLGVVILPLQFGLSVTFLLLDSSFGSNTESISLENLYFNVMTNEEFEEKQEKINMMFYKKIEEFVNRNEEKDKRFNEELREKYKKFETSVIKF
ncbi:MAG: caspase family protein [Cetobacterium sp.]|uniref:caspase family protein n=1 Tax=Cetobacterium sp. TaxID=2071632 RepID=UPI003EE47A78